MNNNKPYGSDVVTGTAWGVYYECDPEDAEKHYESIKKGMGWSEPVKKEENE